MTETLMNETILECPDFNEETNELLKNVSFWVEGFLSCVFAIIGILGNVGSAIVLSGKEMRNSFNWLLIGLACFDNVYLLGSILESIRKDFGLETHIHVILFPYVFYPLQTIAMTGSILMTVSIAFERFVAVHYPLDYNQSANDVGALKIRIMKFMLPVVGLAFGFNTTKFFEAKYTYTNATSISNDNNSSTNAEDILDTYSHDDASVDLVPVLEPTELRMNPLYSIYFNWFRFIVIGIIPFALLVIFYAKIYSDIQNRRANTHRKKQATNQIIQKECKTMVQIRTSGSENHDNNAIELKVIVANEGEDIDDEEEKNDLDNSRLKPPNPFSQSMNGDKVPRSISDKDISNSLRKKHRSKSICVSAGSLLGSGSGRNKNNADELSSSIEDREHHCLNGIEKGEHPVALSVATPKLTRSTLSLNIHRKIKNYANARRRRMEDQMATIFMGYILVFLVCHSPRLMLNIYELATIREAVECSSAEKQPFPLWSLVVMCVSHLLLVVNSSINILVYCVLSTKFREEACKVWSRFRNKYCNCKNANSFY